MVYLTLAQIAWGNCVTKVPTRVITVDPVRPDPDALRTAAKVLRAGGLVAFPTETVYGLGANALDADAVRQVFEAKGRPPVNPLIVHVHGESMLRQVVADWPPMAATLAARFWPGPLTLILPKRESVPDLVTSGGSTIAVRTPGHPVAVELIREAGIPLAAPSANRSGEISPTRAEHVSAGLAGRIDLILDGGPTPNGIESTVLDLTTQPPTLLRPGPVGIAELEAVVGPIRRQRKAADGPLPSPGMMPRHYAPRTPIELVSGRANFDERAEVLRSRGENFREVVLGGTGCDEWRIPLPSNPAGYAARLYEVLHRLDGLGLSRILIEMPPEEDEWMAVRDRLSRAAAE
ncbi:MAG TPA: L-threonylcarbamoyladenylate synthase [Gemmataceae bacterium]|nr:L-threonylcarbamoyladenylate synthase [Gemmataceae bacterium]